MLAKDFEDQEAVHMPCIIQPKLNGVRAKWDPERRLFISRQGEVFNALAIPHLYDGYLNVTTCLDGELYCHGMAFQDICGIVAIARTSAHPDHQKVQFWPFDVISSAPTEERLKHHNIVVPWHHAGSIADIKYHHEQWIAQGFEGTMIRRLGVPYQAGRTADLLKLKKKHTASVTITGFEPGKGKFLGAVGAVWVDLNSKHHFKLGGGNISENQRRAMWQKRDEWLGRTISIEYCETATSGKPLKAQIKSLAP